MAQFNITVGDWSGDGHDKSDTYVINVSDFFTQEQMVANYLANVEEWGFSPKDIAYEYEDASIKKEHYDTLVSHGFDPGWFSLEENGTIYLEGGPRVMVHICMFFVAHGLKDFTWSIEEPPSLPSLFGGYGAACGNEFVGYGLYY